MGGAHGNELGQAVVGSEKRLKRFLDQQKFERLFLE